MLTMINDIPNNLHTFNKPTMKPFSNVPETLHWLLWNKSVVTNFKLQFTMSDLRYPKKIKRGSSRSTSAVPPIKYRKETSLYVYDKVSWMFL